MKRQSIAAWIFVLAGSAIALTASLVFQWLRFKSEPTFRGAAARAYPQAQYDTGAREKDLPSRARLLSYHDYSFMLRQGEQFSLSDIIESTDTAIARQGQFKIQWSSSDTSVAVVDSVGRVTAVGPGNAKIVASLDEQELSQPAYIVVPETAQTQKEESPEADTGSSDVKTPDSLSAESDQSRRGGTQQGDGEATLSEFIREVLGELLVTAGDYVLLAIFLLWAKSKGIKLSELPDHLFGG